MILLDPLARPVIGHRGNRAFAPENTIPSMLEAIALGVDGMEFDVHVTHDGQLVVMHDPTLDRTTSERGDIARRTLAELRTIDAGYHFTTDGGRTFPWRGRDARIPSFDDVIESLPTTLPIIIEIKTARASEAVRTAVRRHNLGARAIVAGFDDASMRPLRNEAFALGASTRQLARALPAVMLGRSLTPNFRAVCIPPTYRGFPVPIAGFVRALRGTGVVTHVWTINSATHAQKLWHAGVNGIISDDPATILAARSTP